MLKKLADAAVNIAIFTVSVCTTVFAAGVMVYLFKAHVTCIDFVQWCVIH